MSALLTQRRALLAIAALCVAGVAAALAGQYGFDMRPCPWCILQRVIFVVIALLCLAGAAARAPAAHRAAAAAAIVLCVLGGAAALYQHFVAAKSSSCNLTLADKVITALRLDTALPSLFEVTGSCADAAVSVMGVPFEFWSLALFALLATMAARLALRRN
jgi:protein dithiol:quinone oxidoreductase